MSDTYDIPDWIAERVGIAPTPAPTTRFSTKSVLDEGSRPRAAEPPPEVTFDRRGRSTAKHFIDMHSGYRKELNRMRDVVAQIRQGAMSVGDARDAMNQMSLRANNWALGNFCQQQCLSFTGHHTLESDVNFPWLREHDPLVEAVIERLLAEHATIHDLIEDVDRALVHLVTHPGDFDQISDAVDLLVDTMLSHFAYEERELIAPMAQYGLGMGSM